jgi:CRP-like cAMP-binding protein
MIPTIEKVLFLKRVRLFEFLSIEELAQIAQLSEAVEYEKDDPIIRQGELGKTMYVILNGTVRVHRDNREMARLGEGEVFGEMTLLDAEPRSASVTALTNVTLLRIRQADFDDLLDEKPEIGRGIIHVLCARLRDAMQEKNG